MEIRIHSARRRPIPISDGARLIARPSGGPRDPLDTRVGGPTLAERNPLHPPVFRPAIRAASHGVSLRFLPETKTDGVGFEPTNDFRRCRFSRPVHSTALPPIQTAAVSPRPRTSVARACRRSCQRRSLASLPPPSAGGPDPPPGIPPASVPQGSPLTNRPIWPKTVVLTPGSRVDFPARGTPCPRRPLRDRTPTPHEHPTGPAISWAASATG